jgi:hypothetical protein
MWKEENYFVGWRKDVRWVIRALSFWSFKLALFHRFVLYNGWQLCTRQILSR